MKIRRIRTFKGVLPILLCVALLASGCAVLNAIAKWLPVGLQAFAQIVMILTDSGAITPGQASSVSDKATIIKADFADLKAAVDDAEKTSKDLYQSKIAKVDAVIGSLQGHLTQLQTDAHVPEKAQKVVNESVGALRLILATYQAQLPTANNVARGSAHAGKLPDIGAFRKNFNAILASNGYGQYQVR
jgi:hypothetical protein